MKQICLVITAIAFVFGLSLEASARDIPVFIPGVGFVDAGKTKADQKSQKRLLEQKSRQRLGGNSGGGGHEDGLDFQRTALQALNGLRTNMPELYQEVKLLGLDRIIRVMTVIVVEDDLVVDAQSDVQDSVAENFPQTITVRLSGPRWRALRDQGLREGIALHEILSLAEVESTGNYRISAQYTTSLTGARLETLTPAAQVSRGASTNIATPNLSLYEVLQKNYMESSDEILLEDLQEFSNERKYTCMWVSKTDGKYQPPMSGSLAFKADRFKPSILIDDMASTHFLADESMKASDNQFVFLTRDNDIQRTRIRTTNVRKSNGHLTFNWGERILKPGADESESFAYGRCYPLSQVQNRKAK